MYFSALLYQLHLMKTTQMSADVFWLIDAPDIKVISCHDPFYWRITQETDCSFQAMASCIEQGCLWLPPELQRAVFMNYLKPAWIAYLNIWSCLQLRRRLPGDAAPWRTQGSQRTMVVDAAPPTSAPRRPRAGLCRISLLSGG